MKTPFRRATTLALVTAAATLGACASTPPTTQTVTLTGDAEVPGFATAANGNATITVLPDGTVMGSMIAYNFKPTMGHIHMGAAGANGPVIVPMTQNGYVLTVPPGTKFTPEQLAAYKAGNTYVNIHSVAHPGGEVRAQLKGL